MGRLLCNSRGKPRSLGAPAAAAAAAAALPCASLERKEVGLHKVHLLPLVAVLQAEVGGKRWRQEMGGGRVGMESSGLACAVSDTQCESSRATQQLGCTTPTATPRNAVRWVAAPRRGPCLSGVRGGPVVDQEVLLLLLGGGGVEVAPRLANNEVGNLLQGGGWACVCVCVCVCGWCVLRG